MASRGGWSGRRAARRGAFRQLVRTRCSRLVCPHSEAEGGRGSQGRTRNNVDRLELTRRFARGRSHRPALSGRFEPVPPPKMGQRTLTSVLQTGQKRMTATGIGPAISCVARRDLGSRRVEPLLHAAPLQSGPRRVLADPTRGLLIQAWRANGSDQSFLSSTDTHDRK